MKKKLIIALSIILISSFLGAVLSAAWNLDHLVAGKLESVNVTYYRCVTCPNQTKTIVITDESKMKALENLFFYRFTNPLAPVTNEKGVLDVQFIYQNKTLSFDVVGTVPGGYPPAIKYGDRSRRYELSQADLDKILELVAEVYK